MFERYVAATLVSETKSCLIIRKRKLQNLMNMVLPRIPVLLDGYWWVGIVSAESSVIMKPYISTDRKVWFWKKYSIWALGCCYFKNDKTNHFILPLTISGDAKVLWGDLCVVLWYFMEWVLPKVSIFVKLLVFWRWKGTKFYLHFI